VERVEPVARPRSSRYQHLLRLAAPWIVAGAMVALLVAPAAWVGASLASPSTSNLPVAGPRQTTAFTRPTGAGGGFTGRRPFNGSFAPADGFPGGAAPPFASGGGFTPPTGATSSRSGSSATNLQVNSDLIAYLEARATADSFLFATTSSMTASPYIISTGKPVMALGGFSGSDPILTVAQLQALVANGAVRYFLLGSGGGGFGGGPGGSSSASSWVTNSCTVVSSSEWSSSTSSSQGGGMQLYDCAGKA
jgi:4-amino-4-deoxy-L-arabinose transferase-like glycosyltransferase